MQTAPLVLQTYRHTHSNADGGPTHTHTSLQTAPLVLQTYRHATLQTEDLHIHTQHGRLRPWCYTPTDTQPLQTEDLQVHTHSTADCAPSATHLQTHNH